MQRETQKTITKWQKKTFGKADDPVRILGRALEEFSECLSSVGFWGRAVVVKECAYQIQRKGKYEDFRIKWRLTAEELADVLIVLYSACSAAGIDLHKEVDKKMAKNRARKWKKTGAGMGQHED